MTRTRRTEWDERMLTDPGVAAEIRRDIGRFAYSDWERKLNAESSLFEICARRVK